MRSLDKNFYSLSNELSHFASRPGVHCAGGCGKDSVLQYVRDQHLGDISLQFCPESPELLHLPRPHSAGVRGRLPPGLEHEGLGRDGGGGPGQGAVGQCRQDHDWGQR